LLRAWRHAALGVVDRLADHIDYVDGDFAIVVGIGVGVGF
jgi:hypothetical protein